MYAASARPARMARMSFMWVVGWNVPTLSPFL
jgi:hypothetical protein